MKKKPPAKAPQKAPKKTSKSIVKNKRVDLEAPAFLLEEGHKSAKGPLYKITYHKQVYYVLGTAHVSKESVRDVENLIKDIKPDIICIELCESRYHSIKDKERWKKLDIVEVIKQKKIYLLMSSVILSAFQNKIGQNQGVRAGEEMLTAIELAEKTQTPLELIDRDVQITLKRTWQSLGYFTKMFAFSELLASLFYSGGVDEKQIEEMKKKDALESLFDSMPVRLHKIKEIIITERDKFLAQKMKLAGRKHPKKKKFLAVVGAGHLPGIAKFFQDEVDIPHLESLKKKSKWWGAFKFFAPILIIMFAFWYFSDGADSKKILQGIYWWAGIKAFFSAIFALLMLAHPLAILAAALSAPISNFNPVLKPGWLAALIEAKFRKPKVSDFESIADDTKSLKGFYRNKVMRIFALFTLPQLGSSIGTGVALWFITKYVL